MNFPHISELNELLKKEYARFALLMQYQECGIETDEEECTEDECQEEGCCSGCEYEEEIDDEEDEEEEEDENADFDPYEYALLFSVVRIASYVQSIIQVGYAKAHPAKSEASFDEAMRWLLQAGLAKHEDELNELALLFTFFEETVQPQTGAEILCYTEDTDRLPTLPLSQTVGLVETALTIAQNIARKA